MQKFINIFQIGEMKRVKDIFRCGLVYLVLFPTRSAYWGIGDDAGPINNKGRNTSAHTIYSPPPS